MLEMKGNLSSWEATLKAAGYLGAHGVSEYRDIEKKSLEEQCALLKNESVWAESKDFGNKDGMVMMAGPNFDVVVLQHDGSVFNSKDDPIMVKSLIQNGDDCIEDCNGNELLPQLCILSKTVLNDPMFHGKPFVNALSVFDKGTFEDFFDYYEQMTEYVNSCLIHQHGIRIGQVGSEEIGSELDLPIIDFEYDELSSISLCICPVVNVSEFVEVEQHETYSVPRYAGADESFGEGQTTFVASLPYSPKTSLLFLDGPDYCYASKSFDVLSMKLENEKLDKSEDFER